MLIHFYALPLGMRYMLLSALGFALMSCCVKLVSVYHIPVLEIVAARSFVSIIISYIDIQRKRISMWGHNKPLLFMRGFIGTFALICVYYAVTTLPLAEATILQYLHPAFTAVLALIFLKEKIQASTIICIALCLVGLVIMIHPNLTFNAPVELPSLSLAAALTGSFGSALAYIIVKRLSHNEDASVIIFYFPLIALPISLFLLGDNFVTPSKEALFLLLFVGIFTQVGQVGLTKAMQTEFASKATAYSYIQVIFSIALGWIVFKEIPVIWTWIGGAFIIMGALINVLGIPSMKIIRSR